MTNLRRYYLRLLLFSVLLAAAALFFARIADEWLISDAYLFFAPFFLGSGMLSAYVQQKSLSGRARGFANAFVGLTMTRFFFYLMIMVGYSLLFRADASRFIIWFMVFYLCYTSFEVFSLFRTIRKRD